MTLTLTPQDWQLATWRPFTPLERPQQRPFHWSTLLDYYKSTVRRKGNYAWSWSWSKIDLDLGMSRQEAHFWADSLILAARQSQRVEATQWLRDPREARYTGEPDWEEMWAEIQNSRVILSTKIIKPLFILFPAIRLIPLLEMQYLNFTYEFRDNVLPYLTTGERESLRGILRSRLPLTPWPSANAHRTAQLYLIAAYLGLHDELHRGVLSWPDDEFGRNPHRSQDIHRTRPQEIIMGLGEPGAVVAQMTRLNLPLRTEAHVGGWLAHTGLDHLGFIGDSIVSCRRATMAKAMTQKLGEAAIAPETAVVMMNAMHDSLAPQNGRSWLETHPEQAATGLLSLAQERTKLSQTTLHFLRDLNRAGHEALLRQSAGDALYDALINAGLSDNPLFDETTTPDWLREGSAGVAAASQATLPDWLKLTDLPAIECGDYAFSDAQKTAVLLALTAPKAHRFWLNQLQQQVEPASLDAFVWGLLDVWQYQNIGARGKWVFNGVSDLGSDALLTRFNKQLRDWGDRKKDNWIQLGLDCLQHNGSDMALLQLHHLEQSFSRKKLRTMAGQAITVVAKMRRISRAELGDRMVPDCGLDNNGRFTLDFGPRQFQFVMGPDMTPLLRDDKGKLRKSLPSPRVSDDPEKVAQARSQWQTFKKQLGKVLKVQTARLEKALVDERRWTQAKFEKYFQLHPLMRHFAQFWVWGVFGEQTVVVEQVIETAVPGQSNTADHNTSTTNPAKKQEDILPAAWSLIKSIFLPPPTKTAPKQSKPGSTRPTIKRLIRTEQKQDGQLLTTFRLTADSSFADCHDELIADPFAGVENGRIGLIHPAHLASATWEAWSQILHDYEIVPPFPQIGRPLYQHTLTPQEIASRTIARFGDSPVHVLSLRGKLANVGWQPGQRANLGFFERYFPQAGITAVAEIRTDWTNRQAAKEQAITNCYFVKGPVKRQNPAKLSKLDLNSLPPLILSEVLYGLKTVTQ